MSFLDGVVSLSFLDSPVEVKARPGQCFFPEGLKLSEHQDIEEIETNFTADSDDGDTQTFDN